MEGKRSLGKESRGVSKGREMMATTFSYPSKKRKGSSTVRGQVQKKMMMDFRGRIGSATYFGKKESLRARS